MSTGDSYGILDDSLDILADVKLEGPSESESFSTSSSAKPDPNATLPEPYEETIPEELLQTPVFHPPSDAPYCSKCSVYDYQNYFNLGCKTCKTEFDNASIPQVFAIMRQWSTDIQGKMDMFINELLAKGCSVHDYDSVSGFTLLHFAARCGSENVGTGEKAAKCTQDLLDRGASIHQRDLWTGMMPIHYAALFNVPLVIEKILDHKSFFDFDIDYQSEEFHKGTALHIACLNLSYEAAKMLLEKGASIETKNELDQKPADVIPEEELEDPSSSHNAAVRKMRKLLQTYEEKENLSVPNYDDVHGKALLLAMGINIGDQVMINDEKIGRLMFCGRVEFSGGVWVGIELGPGEGKHDGSIYGITYFKCPPGCGTFVPITKISKPSKNRKPKAKRESLNLTNNKPDVSKVTSKINTGLSRSNSFCSDVGDEKFAEGDRVVVAGYKKGTIRFIGETKFAPDCEWYGVELDRPIGKHDGSVDGERYFACKPKCGVFCTAGKLKKAPLTRANSNESLNSLNSLNQDTSWSLRVKKLSANSEPQTELEKKEEGGHRSASSSIGSLNSSFNDGASGTSTPRGRSGSRSRSSSATRLRQLTSKSSKSVDYRLEEGMTVLFGSEMAFIRYIGAVSFADGCWLGLELKTAIGKNDGSVHGQRYFTCRPKHGVMVKPTRVSVKGINGAKLLSDQHQNLNRLDVSDNMADSNSKASDATQPE